MCVCVCVHYTTLYAHAQDSLVQWDMGGLGPLAHRTTYLDAANLSITFSLFYRKKEEEKEQKEDNALGHDTHTHT